MLLFALVLSYGLASAAGATAGNREENPVFNVEIPDVGSVIGLQGTTAREGHPVYKFLGIPFAKKPEPFQPPTAFASWSGERDATVHSRGCPALGDGILSTVAPLDAFFPGATAAAEAAEAARKASIAAAVAAGRLAPRDAADEAADDPDDCLTLDIYTHSLDPEAKAPVFFYIHGGAFVLGNSQMANPDFLLDHGDIVLVSVQYRLGPAGFLASEEAGAPGNAALHDLVWALKWVREYVHLFGGDPNHIVAGGVSAGAALSGLLTVSPVTREWLSGGVLFSGGPLVPWTVDPDPERSTRGVGVFAGCLNPDNLADCLRKRSSSALNLAWGIWTVYETYFVKQGMGGVIPAVDASSENPILPRHPLEEILDEDFKGMPLLIGVTKHEGTFVLMQMDLMYIKARSLTKDQKTLNDEIGSLLLEFSEVKDSLFVLDDAIKRLYFSEDTIGNYTAMFEGLVDFTGAGFFKGPAQHYAQLNSLAGSESYLFSFDYAAENNVPSSLYGGNADTVHHGSDQGFLFGSQKYTERDLEVLDIYCELVASFVKDLKPRVHGIEWQPHTRQDDYYLSVQLPPQHLKGFSDTFYIMEQERLDALDPEEPDTEEPKLPEYTTAPGLESTTSGGPGKTRTYLLLLLFLSSLLLAS